MKILIFLALYFLLYFPVNIAWSQSLRLPCGKTTCSTYSIDLSKKELLLKYKDESGARFSNIASLEKWGKLYGKKLIFATNAGIFSRTFSPLGLTVIDGKEIVALNKEQGAGNFYLKPNGIFYIAQNQARIVETSEFQALQVSYASQSGPLLINNGKIHPQFQQGSTNVKIRNAVGVVNDSLIVFVISDGPINFYDLSVFFRDSLSCQNALYLDGVISEMYLPELGIIEKGGDFAAIFAVFAEQTKNLEKHAKDSVSQ